MTPAIQTRYKGYHFRSRLEARWAVFFDAMGLTWEYEPEGFELAGGEFYLPDFFVKDWDSFVEVKPLIGECTFDKAIRFARQSKKSIALLDGVPAIRSYRLISLETREAGERECDDAVVFIYRRLKYAPIYYAWGEFDVGKAPGWLQADNHPEYFAAVAAARAARFEHGETP